MNKPITPLTPDPTIGSVDECGQQIWSPEEEAAIARVHRDPAYWAAVEEALASADRREGYTHEEMLALSAAAKRQWFADRGLPIPSKYAV